MTITNHPFHRSGRALLTHPALASGDDAKSLEGIGWKEPRNNGYALPLHHRRASLDFSMRPERAASGGRRSSLFSRELLPCMPGVSDLAGYRRTLPMRYVGCCLPPLLTGSASRTKFITRLNTQPAHSPVNASPLPLRAPPHDSGPL